MKRVSFALGILILCAIATTSAGKQPVPKAYWINDGKGNFMGNFINID
jgi:hypothetical protein